MKNVWLRGHKYAITDEQFAHIHNEENEEAHDVDLAIKYCKVTPADAIGSRIRKRVDVDDDGEAPKKGKK